MPWNLKAWLLRKPARENTLARPMNWDDLYRDAMRAAREELRKNLALILHAPLPVAERLRRIATSVGEPLPEVRDTGDTPVRISTAPPQVASPRAFDEHNWQFFVQHKRTERELPIVPWSARQRRASQP